MLPIVFLTNPLGSYLARVSIKHLASEIAIISGGKNVENSLRDPYHLPFPSFSPFFGRNVELVSIVTMCVTHVHEVDHLSI